MEDLRNASELLVRALLVRRKYMSVSGQQFPSATERFLRQLQPEETSNQSVSLSLHSNTAAAAAAAAGATDQGGSVNSPRSANPAGAFESASLTARTCDGRLINSSF